MHPSPPSGELPEAVAIQRAQRGDPQAFERLYQLHKGRVYSLCLRMLGNPADAEELAQEAFLQLYRKVASFRGESAFSTWLHRLTVNVVLMHLRRKSLPQTSLEAMTEPEEGEEGPRRDFGGEDPNLRGSVDRMTLQRALAELPAGYRAVLVLHDIEGYQHHEIAEMLGCSVGNSKSQLHKARLRLRTMLLEARARAAGRPTP